MNINDHAKTIALKTRDIKDTTNQVNVTFAPVEKGCEIQIIEGYVYGGIKSTIMQGDIEKPLLFKRVEPIYGNIDLTTITAPGKDNMFMYGDYIQRVIRSFIGSDETLPIPEDDCYASVIGPIFSKLHIKGTTGYGTNHVTKEDILSIMNNFPEYNILEDDDGAILSEDILYLPIYSHEMTTMGNLLDRMPEKGRVAIRAVANGVRFGTYVRIILRDGVEFTLWHSALKLIILGKG